MPDNSTTVSRRTLLKATGAAVGATVGAVGSAGAAPGCVVTTTDANAYKECPGENYVWTVPEGSNGFINKTCTDMYGNEWAEVTWECDETWTVSTDDIAEDDACYC